MPTIRLSALSHLLQNDGMNIISRVEDIDSISAFSDSARVLLQSSSPLLRLRQYRSALPRFDKQFWAHLADAGWTSILSPEATGGLELGVRHACAIAEQIGRHPLPEPFIGAAIQPVALLATLKPSAQRDTLLTAISSGTAIIGTAWQERIGKLEPEESLSTRATHLKGEYRLDGCKRWVVPGSGADGWLVSATSGTEAGIWWVPASTPGLSVMEDSRIDGSTSATLVLREACVPAAHRLAAGEDALAALQRACDTARLVQAAELLGIAREALQTTLDYVSTRMQFGKPIGANQALQHRLVDAYIQVELASACLDEAIDAAETQNDLLASSASRAKARCLDTALHVTRLGVQLHGAIGFTDEHDLGFYLKRALQHASWLGSANAMRLRWHKSNAPRAEASETTQAEWQDTAPLTDWAAVSEQEFRNIVRGFLHRHYPDHLRHPSQRLHWADCKEWYLTLAKHGWIAPAWPREYGGMGLPGDKLLAFIEEMEDYGVARLPDQGIINLGPVLIRFGTPEQRQEYLPKIIAGEHIWCQGYSEPNAGSDLASLRTEAILDGDTFVVNGQKIWTTLAQDATHMFALVRTDKSAKKQEGISFLLIDLSTPGVSVRPIRNVAGEEEFCEVFFDNVRVPRRNLVGDMNGGWRIAKALLGFERLFVGSPKTAQYAMGLLKKIANALNLFENPVFVSRYAQLELDVADLKASYGRFAELVKRGDELPPSVSLLKIYASETYTAITRFLAESCEEFGGSVGPIEFQGALVNVVSPLLNAMITSIYAGSNEIQRNILAKSVLKLPN